MRSKNPIYQTNDAGFTSDGYYLGQSEYINEFKHNGPLPRLSVRTMSVLNQHRDKTQKVNARRIASFDDVHAEDMRKYYGDGLDSFNDGARITYAVSNKPERSQRNRWRK